MRKYFLSLPRKTQWWHPVVGGLVVGVMGWFVPQMMGVGYTYVGNALNGTMVLRLMLLLVVLKLLGVTVSYATGNAGGIFGPALFLGAMLGGIVGTISHHFLPGYTAQPGAYALVGMGALFAGIVRAPMTSVLMIFEMTRDYAVIVPLMIANMTSLVIASHFQEEPVYEALAHQDGIRLPNQSDRDESNFRTVMQVMRTAPLVLPGELTLREAAETIQKSNAGLVDGHPEDTSRYRNWPVADKDFFVGMIGKETIDQAVSDGRGDRPLITAVQTMNVPYAHADQPLFLVLDTMSKTHLDVLPVVRRADLHTLVGIVTLRDVLDSYGVDCLGTEPAATNGTISPAVL
jgi:CIC family chloride channel protein